MVATYNFGSVNSFAIISRGNRAGCFALFVALVSHDCCVALPHDTMGLSAVCDCGSSWAYSLTIFNFSHFYFFPLEIYCTVQHC